MPDPVLAWCDDIHSVRGNVSQLQATLNQIITKAPTLAQYKTLISTYDSPEADKTTEAPNILEKLRSIMHSPQVKVAVRLKSLYDKGYLPFLLGLSRINFRSQKSDRFVGYLLDYVPQKVDGAAMFPDEGEFAQKASSDPEQSPYPPSLPPIENQSLLRLVLTDKSMRQPSDFLQSEFAEGFHDYNNNHNRKLSRRGRDILSLALTDILDEAFPKAHEDDLDFLKLRLTATPVLAKLAFCYSLSDSVMHQMPQDASLDDKLIVLRTVFLAYIGGMSRSQYTFSAIRLWIQSLYEPLIVKLQETAVSHSQLKSVFHLAYAELIFLLRRVNSLTEEPTKRIRYEFKILSEEPSVCQLIVSSTELGVGTGSSLELAKQKAAHATLETPELRTQLMEILVASFRTPAKDKEHPVSQDISAESKPLASDDEAYSPGFSGDDYEPEEPQNVVENRSLSEKQTAVTDKQHTQKLSPVSVPPINYGEWPPAQGKTHNGTGKAEVPKKAQKAHNQPAPQPAPQPQARMPLPYGKLPPIPNMKKKGGKN